MKKHLEDQLIELAFGDRTETGVAEMTTTPEAAERLKQYRTMRSALGQLRELPEHQLSTDRLREALLHQGLKRRRSFPWQALGYISAASSLFLCAFFLSRDLRRAGIQTQVAVSPVKPNRSVIQLPEVKTAPRSSESVASTEISKVAPVIDRRPSVHSRESRSPDLVLNTDSRPVLKLTDTMQPAVAPVNGRALSPTMADLRTSGPGRNVAFTAAPSRPLSTSNAMVLIQMKTDADSGLDTAQEVTANGDVLVGG